MNQLLKYKQTLIIIAIAIVCLILVFAFCKFSGLGTRIRTAFAQKKLDELLDKEMSDENITLSDASLEMYAQKLYTAMEGGGTDEDAIYEVFGDMACKSDIIALIRTFGVRDGRNLVGWITSELNAKERTKLNSIIAANNINYKF